MPKPKTPDITTPLPGTKKQLKARAQSRVVVDHGSHHALELSRADFRVRFIPVPEVGPVAVHEELTPVFDKRFATLEGFPPDRAAKFFIGVAQDRGATPEALDALASLVSLTAHEQETAMEQHKAGVAARSKGTKTTKRAGKNGVAKKGGSKPAVAKAAGPTAAGRFRELIMKGGITDDQIFQRVQKEFHLPATKRGYVAWYRNDLKKKGQKPPDAKVAS